MSDYYNVTTNNGDAAIATAIANNTKLNITHIAFGDGNGAVPTPNKARTTLVKEVYRQAVTKYERHPTIANYLIVEVVIPSEIGGFYIREIGLIADGILISHGSHAPFFKVAESDGVSEFHLKYTINIQDGGVVDLTLDESLIYATEAWVDENYVPRNQIVDNLTTNDATKPVSAKQAKNLKDSITAIEDIVLYAPIAWPSTTIPSGHLAMMGQTISQAQYPKLYALYGSKLPDMRAYSIRGLDFGRGIDSGRLILSEQNDSFKSHYHSDSAGSGQQWAISNAEPGTSSAYAKTYRTAGDYWYVPNGADPEGAAAGLYTNMTGGSETRPKNVAFLYIVKAG